MLDISFLAQLAEHHPADLRHPVRGFRIGRRQIDFNSESAIMGVINLSPDSWYRESVCLNREQAVRRLELLSAQGADVIDLGAESTLPNASRSGAKQQQQRVLPLIEAAASRRIPVSIETYLPSVARAGLEAGAAVVNLTRGRNNRELYKLAADHNAAVVICYVQGKDVRSVRHLLFDGDPIEVMLKWFGRQTEEAERCGVKKIFIDPGLGFYYRNLMDSAERVRHQSQVFLNSFRLRKLGWPICHALPHAFEYFGEEVRSAEPFFAVLAALGQTSLFRTHEVSRVRAVLDTLQVIE